MGDAVAAGTGRSLGAGEAFGSVAGWSAALAGMSLADSAFQEVSTNGPAPTGWTLNGSSASVSIGVSLRRCAGSSPMVAAWRKPPIGVVSSKTTVRASTAVTLTSRHDAASAPV